MKYLSIWMLLSIVLSSCAYTRVVPLQSNTYPAIPESEVTIFVDENDLPQEYEKVALITTDYDSGFDKVKWNSVKKKCASIGCNGVYQKYEDRASQGEQIAGAIFGLYTTDKAEFIAIRYDSNRAEKANVSDDNETSIVYEKSMSEIKDYLESSASKDKVEGFYSVFRTTINKGSKEVVSDRKLIGNIAILYYDKNLFDVVDYYDELRFANDQPDIVGEIELDSELSCSYRTLDSKNQVIDEYLIIDYSNGFEIRYEDEYSTHINFYVKK